MIYIYKIVNFYQNSYKLKIEEKVLQLIRMRIIEDYKIIIIFNGDKKIMKKYKRKIKKYQRD